MSTADKQVKKKKRVYQVAKEFHVSNEALIEFLHDEGFKVRNQMAPLSDAMLDLVTKNYQKQDVETDKAPDFRKRIEEKKKEDEARKQAVREEINEVLEASKEAVFQPVKTVKRKHKKAEPKKKVAAEAEEGKTLEIAKEKVDQVEEVPKPIEKIKLPIEDVKEAAKAEKKSTEKDKEKSDKPKRHLKHPIEKMPGDIIKLEPETEEESKSSKKRRRKRKTVDAKPVSAGEDKKPTKRKRKRRKSKTKIDEKEIEASIKETLAKMDQTTKRKRHKKERVNEEVEVDEGNVIRTAEFASVAELANLMEVDPSEVIQVCLSMGLMVSINQRLDRDTIIMVADEFEFDVKFLSEYGEEKLEEAAEQEEEVDESKLEPRPPVVTIMGHVDHGKTSLLDYIRRSNIISGESGGITQHIGAYEVEVNAKKICFLDTPGHEAFTAMRARGAQATDIVVLVVAADDDVMPQTIEAINHARAAGVPIIVAINKIDRPAANADKIKQRLADYNVLVEDWGGKIQSAEISAKLGTGVDYLLELILLEAEVLELKANPCCNAKAVIVEVRLDKGRGIVGTALVQKGTLRKSDIFVAGQYNGRVRAMFDERNKPVDEAPPSAPVQILGFTGMPQAGDQLVVVGSEQEAKEISLKRQQLRREHSFRQIKRLTLDQISKRIADGEVKELSIIIKGDVDGSVEAVSDSLMELGTSDVAVRIIDKGVGTIKESDVLLAMASQAVILGFHVKPNNQAKELAEKEDIDIRLYKVIYDAVNDVKLALSGLLEPERSEETIATIEVREVFKASRIGQIAGCFVTTGKVMRNSLARVIRDEVVIYDGKISSLKRFKEDVREVATGFECGLTLEKFNDVQIGDIVEAYHIVETERTL